MQLNNQSVLGLFALALCCQPAFAETPSVDVRAVMPEKHHAVFRKYCLDCHSSDTKEGGVDLETISFQISRNIPTAELWAKILNAINSGEMPPEDAEPISNAEKLTFLEDLSTQMVVARRILSDSDGVITMRRLNRREYQNTVEALLGVRPNVSSLPDDQASAGFDTAGASLFFSSDQLEQYLAVARDTLNLALHPEEPRKGRTERIEPEEKYTQLYSELLAELHDTEKRAEAYLAQQGKPATEFGFLDEGQARKQLRATATYMPQLVDYLGRPETKHGATLISRIKTGVSKVQTRIVDGGPGMTLRLRVRAGAYAGVDPRYQYLEFTMRSWTGGYTTEIGWRKVKGTLEQPEIIEFDVFAPAGERVQFYVHQRTHQGRGDKNLWAQHRETNPIGTPPGLWVDWVEVDYPPQQGQWPEAAKLVLFDRPADWSEDRYAREVITRFATRAFRTERPSSEYVDKLVARYNAKRAEGLTLQDALIEPLGIVLSSPGFLYMVESSGGDESLTELELAVRLSYFLWSAPPDDELLSLANEGRLSEPDVLRQQTSRLLEDSRSDRFVRGFVHQWLGLARLGMFEFTARDYPDFDNAARESAREEVYQTIHTMLDEKLPLATLLKSDFIVVNDVLADYYGLSGVEGQAFRKVRLSAESPRGGLLGTAAVLAMGSDGLRTSPVERGAWVLRHLLHDPPPPAPPNVPQVSRFEGEVFSSRQLQLAHQQEPQCAQCHRKIDPIGFGLENFDAAGLWRERELVRTGRRKKDVTTFAIEPGGQLADGTRFTDYTSLRDVIASRTDDFARGLTESLIEYGLGRPFGFTDQEFADEIVKQAREHDYELSQFIHALVQSKPFQSK
ncbi:MAG: DUF1592 domain-containing protein [Planctomycetales bacterium]|nr:DUF1592 domain-containing protein [Planctomycetales bacterium]